MNVFFFFWLYLKQMNFKLIWIVDHPRGKKKQKKKKKLDHPKKNLSPLKIKFDLSKILVY